jgi:alkanesulfonate monooxygenase SsuD/methylene tetrahydromethanopterin reductase-like flavin-dependent oxidoreductase (luciferase family)
VKGTPVEVGVVLPTREAVLRGLDARSLIELARLIEANGFDSAWAGDSLLARPRVDPLTLLAGVAATCPSLTVGTAALMGSLRHPVVTAHAIATLDQLAGGRLVLGLGAGAPLPQTKAEFDAAGADFEHRIGRLTETVEIWRALWDPQRDAAQPLRFEGRYWTFEGIEGLPLPTRPGGPPLWLAGGGERALQRAGRQFDGWLPYPPTPADYARGLDVATRAAVDAGRDASAFTPAVYVTVNIGDETTGRGELEQYVVEYYGMPFELMASLQAFYAGGVEGCIDWLQGYVEAGARHVVLRFGSFDPGGQLREHSGRLSSALRS